MSLRYWSQWTETERKDGDKEREIDKEKDKEIKTSRWKPGGRQRQK